MSVEPSTGTAEQDIDPESDDDEWVADYCSWWVIPCGYSTRRSKFVHVPDAVRMRAANDPDDEPAAETLCYTDSRESTDYQTKSHALLPVNYRPVCSKCKRELTEVIADEWRDSRR